MIDQVTIDRIFESANIVDVVQDYVTLKRRGANYMACCPFHQEKTPSFVVSPAKNIFKCFGCGKAGNPVTFVMEHDHLTYVEALRQLGKKYGIEIKEHETTPEQQQQNNDRESMMVLTAFAQESFSRNLLQHIDGRNIAMPYFVERGFSKATIEKFQLGYCLDSRDAFSATALKQGYQKDFLVKTGLSIERDNGQLLDRFYGRVMFPIHSLSGRTIAFGGRTLRTDKAVAKYLNSPESEIYYKSKVLYGIYFAKKAMVQHNKCFLVEGYTDVISMHQAGIENVVASSGTSLTTDQIRLIKRFTPNVTVLYDGDAAGIKASLRGIDMLLEEGMNIKTLLLPDGHDPDSFARSRSASEFTAYIDEHEEDFIRFKTKILLTDSKADPAKRAEVITDIVRSIAIIPETIYRSVYINECSRLMDMAEDVLTQAVAKVRRERIYEGRDTAQTTSAQPQQAAPMHTPAMPAFVEKIYCREEERELVYYLLKYGEHPFGETNVARYIIQEMLNEDLTFQNLEYQTIFEEYCRLGERGRVEVKHFINHPDPKICELAIDLLSARHTLSRGWQRRGAEEQPEEQRLHQQLPKAVNVYKSKIVTQAISQLAQQLQGATDQQVDDYMQRLKVLGEYRTRFARLLDRVVM